MDSNCLIQYFIFESCSLVTQCNTYKWFGKRVQMVYILYLFLSLNEIWEYIIGCCYSTCVHHVFGKKYGWMEKKYMGWMPQYWNKNILEKQLYKKPSKHIKILAYENKLKPVVQSLTVFQNSWQVEYHCFK